MYPSLVIALQLSYLHVDRLACADTTFYNILCINSSSSRSSSSSSSSRSSSCNRDGALEYLRHIRVYVDGSRLHAADHVISPIRFIARYSLLYQIIKRLE